MSPIVPSILQAPNLRSLKISPNFFLLGERFNVSNGIDSLLRFHIQHLEVILYDLKVIEIIFERCQYLISVLFKFDRDSDEVELTNGIEKWFSENTINSTFSFGICFTIVWIGQKKIYIDKVHNNNIESVE